MDPTSPPLSLPYPQETSFLPAPPSRGIQLSTQVQPVAPKPFISSSEVAVFDGVRCRPQDRFVEKCIEQKCINHKGKILKKGLRLPALNLNSHQRVKNFLDEERPVHPFSEGGALKPAVANFQLRTFLVNLKYYLANSEFKIYFTIQLVGSGVKPHLVDPNDPSYLEACLKVIGVENPVLSKELLSSLDLSSMDNDFRIKVFWSPGVKVEDERTIKAALGCLGGCIKLALKDSLIPCQGFSANSINIEDLILKNPEGAVIYDNRKPKKAFFVTAFGIPGKETDIVILDTRFCENSIQNVADNIYLNLTELELGKFYLENDPVDGLSDLQPIFDWTAQVIRLPPSILKKLDNRCWIKILSLLSKGWVMLIGPDKKDPMNTVIPESKETRLNRIEAGFKKYAGSHRNFIYTLALQALFSLERKGVKNPEGEFIEYKKLIEEIEQKNPRLKEQKYAEEIEAILDLLDQGVKVKELTSLLKLAAFMGAHDKSSEALYARPFQSLLIPLKEEENTSTLFFPFFNSDIQSLLNDLQLLEKSAKENEKIGEKLELSLLNDLQSLEKSAKENEKIGEKLELLLRKISPKYTDIQPFDRGDFIESFARCCLESPLPGFLEKGSKILRSVYGENLDSWKRFIRDYPLLFIELLSLLKTDENRKEYFEKKENLFELLIFTQLGLSIEKRHYFFSLWKILQFSTLNNLVFGIKENREVSVEFLQAAGKEIGKLSFKSRIESLTTLRDEKIIADRLTDLESWIDPALEKIKNETKINYSKIFYIEKIKIFISYLKKYHPEKLEKSLLEGGYWVSLCEKKYLLENLLWLNKFRDIYLKDLINKPCNKKYLQAAIEYEIYRTKEKRLSPELIDLWKQKDLYIQSRDIFWKFYFNFPNDQRNEVVGWLRVNQPKVFVSKFLNDFDPKFFENQMKNWISNDLKKTNKISDKLNLVWQDRKLSTKNREVFWHFWRKIPLNQRESMIHSLCEVKPKEALSHLEEKKESLLDFTPEMSLKLIKRLMIQGKSIDDIVQLPIWQTFHFAEPAKGAKTIKEYESQIDSLNLTETLKKQPERQQYLNALFCYFKISEELIPLDMELLEEWSSFQSLDQRERFLFEYVNKRLLSLEKRFSINFAVETIQFINQVQIYESKFWDRALNVVLKVIQNKKDKKILGEKFELFFKIFFEYSSKNLKRVDENLNTHILKAIELLGEKLYSFEKEQLPLFIIKRWSISQRIEWIFSCPESQLETFIPVFQELLIDSAEEKKSAASQKLPSAFSDDSREKLLRVHNQLTSPSKEILGWFLSRDVLLSHRWDQLTDEIVDHAWIYLGPIDVYFTSEKQEKLITSLSTKLKDESNELMIDLFFNLSADCKSYNPSWWKNCANHSSIFSQNRGYFDAALKRLKDEKVSQKEIAEICNFFLKKGDFKALNQLSIENHLWKILDIPIAVDLSLSFDEYSGNNNIKPLLKVLKSYLLSSYENAEKMIGHLCQKNDYINRLNRLKDRWKNDCSFEEIIIFEHSFVLNTILNNYQNSLIRKYEDWLFDEKRGVPWRLIEVLLYGKEGKKIPHDKSSQKVAILLLLLFERWEIRTRKEWLVLWNWVEKCNDNNLIKLFVKNYIKFCNEVWSSSFPRPENDELNPENALLTPDEYIEEQAQSCLPALENCTIS